MGFVRNYLGNLASMAVGREPARPLLFSYYVTHRCELACRYCCDGEGKPFKEDTVPELSIGEIRRLIRCVSGAADTLDITGGEPLVRDDLETILAEARAAGLRTVVNTKGLGLEDRPDVLRLADVLVLSIDALDPSCLAELIGRPRATAQRVLEALRFVVAARGRAGPRVVLSAVATATNLAEISRVLHLAMEHSLGFQLSPEIIGTSVNPVLRDNQRYAELVGEVISAKRARRGVLGVPGYLRGIGNFSRFRCHPLLMPVIRPDGRMYYPCLESGRARIDLLEAPNYRAALLSARKEQGGVPRCRDSCHIFCHMGLSLLQRHPLSALGELKHWRN